MKLTTFCKHCKSPIEVKTSVNDRAELERKRGTTFKLTCPHCHRPDTYHVNEVRATASGGVALIVAVVLFLSIGIVCLLFARQLFVAGYFHTFLLLAPFAIPVFVYSAMVKQGKTNAALFNRYRA